MCLLNVFEPLHLSILNTHQSQLMQFRFYQCYSIHAHTLKHFLLFIPPMGLTALECFVNILDELVIYVRTISFVPPECLLLHLLNAQYAFYHNADAYNGDHGLRHSLFCSLVKYASTKKTLPQNYRKLFQCFRGLSWLST